MKKISLYFSIIMFAFIIAACGADKPGNEQSNDNVQNESNPNETEQSHLDEPSDLKEPLTLHETADVIVSALSERDMALLSSFAHPDNGIRFTPYSYIDVENDLTFSQEEIADLMEDETTYIWGTWDGSGEPLEYTFAEYYEQFIYDADYVSTKDVVVDERLGHGNTIDNASEVYPNATVVEYYFSGNEEELAGLDWSSLRLVLEIKDGEWLIVGIVHDEWTI